MAEWFEKLAVIVLIVATLQSPLSRHTSPSKGDPGPCGPDGTLLCAGESCTCWYPGD